MFSGPPLPLPSDLPLSFLLDRVRPAETLGGWIRCAAHQLRLRDTGRISGGQILVSADLGFLLGRCNRVALREGTAPVIIDADTILQWRTLQVITALPHLPSLERLAQLVPDIRRCNSLGLLIPIATRSPEEVLAECLAIGVQVSGSRVAYYPRRPSPVANSPAHSP